MMYECNNNDCFYNIDTLIQPPTPSLSSKGEDTKVIGVQITGNKFDKTASIQLSKDGEPEIISMGGKVFYPTIK